MKQREKETLMKSFILQLSNLLEQITPLDLRDKIAFGMFCSALLWLVESS